MSVRVGTSNTADTRQVSAANFERAVYAVGEVEVRLIAAFNALKRCPFRPGDRPSDMRAAWMDCVNDLGLIDQLGLHTTVRPAPPQKHEYDQMVEALGWLLLITDAMQRRIVVARVCGIGWLKIRGFALMSEPTMRKVYRLGLTAIAARLNAKG